MDDCEYCGEDHGEPSPALLAWADQLEAEVRNTARELYSRSLAQRGLVVAVTEEELEAFDTVAAVGADAMLDVLHRHGCLKQGEW